jgi:pyruvate formate lyase activating enzyme
MDPDKHKKWTGVDNKLILENLNILAQTGANINIRIPLIKNVNADKTSITEMARFVSGLPGKTPKINLLPYHSIATNKYNKLGLNYNKMEMDEPSEEEQNIAVALFKKFGIDSEIGG